MIQSRSLSRSRLMAVTIGRRRGVNHHIVLVHGCNADILISQDRLGRNSANDSHAFCDWSPESDDGWSAHWTCSRAFTHRLRVRHSKHRFGIHADIFHLVH